MAGSAKPGIPAARHARAAETATAPPVAPGPIGRPVKDQGHQSPCHHGPSPAGRSGAFCSASAVGGPPVAHGKISYVQSGVLGPFEVRLDDGAFAEVPGARLRGLLTALALEPGHLVPNATLVDWIWGERPPSDAANALQRLVSRLRKALPEGLVEGQTGGYRLMVEPDGVDAVRFERIIGQARTDENPRRVRLLREALALWRGVAMQDVGLQDSAAFDAAVTRLEGLRLTAMEDRFDAEIGRGRGAALVTELTDLVAAHPVRERLVASLMRALVAAGRDTEALLVYQRTREALADELGVDPSPGLSALHVALLRGELGRREENRKTNLHAELTSFVGKDADVAAVRELIAGHRLTTLTGPGGSGKTRLATETARTLLGDLPDGAWLVDLAAIGADGDVAHAALAALGLRDALLGGTPNAELTGRLIAAIREREALLILDNCEHVIDSAALFAHRVLGECRRLRILATSREPLGITGEALWLVEPLAMPERDASPGETESYAAVQLLRDRAGVVPKDLAVDARSLSTMARVCRALDGMPLAIELAAARLQTMSLDQLASRLDDRFRLLTSGSRTAFPRHKTPARGGRLELGAGHRRRHGFRDACCARSRRGEGGDATRGGRRLVLVARRAPGRRPRADRRGYQDPRPGER
jgi:DNA-binding SARP family transcriptional activator